MAKGPAIIVIFCICLLCVFSVMLYLMTTVDPTPIVGGGADLPDSFKTPPMAKQVFLNDPIELEKVDSEDIDFYPSTHIPSNQYSANDTDVFRYLHRKAMPPLWPRAKTIVVDPTMHIVLPPDWPTSSERYDSTPSSRVEVVTGVILDYRDLTSKSKSCRNETALKPIKRRSINNVKLLNDSGSLILKILDGKGHSLVEIKLGSDVNLQKKKSKGNKSPLKDMSYFTTKLENDGLSENSKYVKDTIMTLLSNDSINKSESESKSNFENDIPDITNITDLINLLILTSKDKNNKEKFRTGLTDDKKLSKASLNEYITSFDVTHYNETKSLRNDDGVGRNKNNSIITVAAKNGTDLDKVTKNSSDFEASEVSIKNLNTTSQNNTGMLAAANNTTDYDRKFNNTVFMNMLFEDDIVTNNITTENNDLDKTKSKTILLSDAVFSNFTSVFSKNESEIFS